MSTKAKTRRARGEGAVSPKRTTSGVRFYVSVLETDPTTGQKRRRSHGGYSTRSEAQKALRTLLTRRDQGAYVSPTRQTVEGFLLEWMEAMKSSTIRPSTRESYAMNLKKHV